MQQDSLRLLGFAILAVAVAIGVIACTERGRLSMWVLWERLWRSVRRDRVPMFAIIKRRAEPVEQEFCDRCPQLAKWRVILSDSMVLLLCNHHHDKHLPYIVGAGYEQVEIK